MSRSILNELIEDSGNCRIVSFYKDGGVAITRNNGYAYSGIPAMMADVIETLLKNDYHIDEVVMSDDGKWLVVYNGNGYYSDNLPNSLKQKLHSYRVRHEKIQNVAFNEYGDWIVVSDKHFSASDPNLQQWLRIGYDEYGDIEDVYMSRYSVVACFERGYQYIDAPDALKVALSDCNFSRTMCF